MNMRARACTKPQSRKDYNPRSLSEVTVMTTRPALMQGAAALAHAHASDLVRPAAVIMYSVHAAAGERSAGE